MALCCSALTISDSMPVSDVPVCGCKQARKNTAGSIPRRLSRRRRPARRSEGAAVPHDRPRHRQAHPHGAAAGERLRDDPPARRRGRHRNEARQPQLPSETAKAAPRVAATRYRPQISLTIANLTGLLAYIGERAMRKGAHQTVPVSSPGFQCSDPSIKLIPP